jgi:hypothetical protein
VAIEVSLPRRTFLRHLAAALPTLPILSGMGPTPTLSALHDQRTQLLSATFRPITVPVRGLSNTEEFDKTVAEQRRKLDALFAGQTRADAHTQTRLVDQSGETPHAVFAPSVKRNRVTRFEPSMWMAAPDEWRYLAPVTPASSRFAALPVVAPTFFVRATDNAGALLRKFTRALIRFIDQLISLILRTLRRPVFTIDRIVVEAPWHFLHGTHPPEGVRASTDVPFAPEACMLTAA